MTHNNQIRNITSSWKQSETTLLWGTSDRCYWQAHRARLDSWRKPHWLCLPAAQALWTTSRLAPMGSWWAARGGWHEGMVSRNHLVPSHTISFNDSQPRIAIRGEDIEKYMFTQILHWIRMKHTSLAIKAGLRQQSIICKWSAAMGTDINMCEDVNLSNECLVLLLLEHIPYVLPGFIHAWVFILIWFLSI